MLIFFGDVLFPFKIWMNVKTLTVVSMASVLTQRALTTVFAPTQWSWMPPRKDVCNQLNQMVCLDVRHKCLSSSVLKIVVFIKMEITQE